MAAMQDSPARRSFPKAERLCGRKDIDNLIKRGRFCTVPGPLRFSFVRDTGSGLNRVMISVSKRNFKRAVRRNLLKRRIRESWRLQKHGLAPTGVDILIIYSSKEILPYKDIYDSVGRIIARINALAGARESQPESDEGGTVPTQAKEGGNGEK